MATAVVRQYNRIGGDAGGHLVQIAEEPGTDLAAVTYTTSTQSAAFAVGTEFISFICDAKAHYVVGDNPTATANNLWVPADTVKTVQVTPGQKIAFYDGTS